MFDDDIFTTFDDGIESAWDDTFSAESCGCGDINPGSGLPMMDDNCIDVGGYVYGDGPDYLSDW